VLRLSLSAKDTILLLETMLRHPTPIVFLPLATPTCVILGRVQRLRVRPINEISVLALAWVFT
jgi:hypothetical protein